jgi:ribosomal protein S15
VQTANLSRKEKVRKMKQDPYAWAQAQQRKAANVSRRRELEAQRDAGWGSPIHGIPTPFVESFDTAGQAPLSTPPVDKHGNPLQEPHHLPTSPHLRNYLLSDEEVEKAIEQARRLTEPLIDESRLQSDPEKEKEELDLHAAKHRKAMIAIERIADLANGSAKDRKHANIRRCIDEFGRHTTDLTLENPEPPLSRGVEPQPKPPRAGPDTGSSEVQIAILTAKIRALAHALDGHQGHKDKINKRNLRKLCHKRQRLLRYMEKKERGSGRWHHMLETLGLSPATWKEQISF